MAGRAKGRAAHQRFVPSKPGNSEGIDDAAGLSGDFGTDSVPGEQCDFHDHCRLAPRPSGGNRAVQSIHQPGADIGESLALPPEQNMLIERAAIAPQRQREIGGRGEITTIAQP
jgi:hypothetical protein